MVNFVPAWMRRRPVLTGGYGSNGTGYNDDNSTVRGVYATRIRQHPGTGNTVAPTGTPAYREVPNPGNIEAAIAAALSSSSYRQPHHVEQNIEQNNRWYKSPVTSALVCLAGGILILAGGMLYTVTRPASSDARQPTAQVQTVDSLPSAQAPLSGLPTDRQDQVQRAGLSRNTAVTGSGTDTITAAGNGSDNHDKRMNTKYQPQSPYFISDPLGRVFIEYEMDPGRAVMEQDLAYATETMDFLAELFDSYPNGQVVMKKSSQTGGVKIMPIPMHYPGSIEFELNNPGLAANETVDVFTQTLIPTSELWFREGLSDYVSAVRSVGENVVFSSSTKAGKDYKSLKSGHPPYPEWIGAHGTGRMFDSGLEIEYHFRYPQVKQTIQELMTMSNGGQKITSSKDIKHATSKVAGRDTGELFTTIKAGIEFNSGGTWESIAEFYEKHPEHRTSAK